MNDNENVILLLATLCTAQSMALICLLFPDYYLSIMCVICLVIIGVLTRGRRRK